MANKNQLFVERRPEGDYAVRRPDSARASAVLPTQAEAIKKLSEEQKKFSEIEVIRDLAGRDRIIVLKM